MTLLVKKPKRVDLSDDFVKTFLKIPIKIQIAFRNRLARFNENTYDPLLRNHALKGFYSGYRSINITGDWRAIYSEQLDEKQDLIVIFEAIGTHSQLYK